MKLTCLFLMASIPTVAGLGGTLAITEAMTDPSIVGSNGIVPPMADYWELTNFGGSPVDLTGYKWNDLTGGLAGADDLPFKGLTIQPGESILFVKSGDVANEQDVRDWWGDGLAPSTRVVLYGGNGFGRDGEIIHLWAAGETDPRNVVAEVAFGDATTGVSFTYDPVTGDFGVKSQLGDPGVVRAATRDDIGSPGRTSGPVPVTIRAQPLDAQVCVGSDAVFEVVARGVPAPSYQWFSEKGLLAGEIRSQLIVPKVSDTAVGQYWVEVRSGDRMLESRKCSLSIDPTPRSPSIVGHLVNSGGFVGETAEIRAEVCGYPEPRLQWFRDGVLLEGETDRKLAVPDLSLEDSNAEYCVEVTNALGSARECMQLIVEPIPKLAITEVEPAQIDGCGLSADWFEVTNFDTREISLRGFKWITLNGVAPQLESPLYVTSDIRLRPGQSAIFVERLSPEQFKQWWGADRLPPDLQIGTYTSHGLSQFGDTIYLWGAGATDPNAPIATAAWASADRGISREFEGEGPGALDVASVAGQKGAFQAVGCNDVGSPGYIANPVPRILTLRKDPAGWILRWRAVKGQTFDIEGAASLEGAAWHRLVEITAADWVVETVLPLTESTMYLRLQTP